MVRGMTVAQAARRAEVSTRTISTWITQGLKFEQNGRERRIQLVDLQAHIRAMAESKKDRGRRLASRREIDVP